MTVAISALPAATSADGADIVPIVQGGTTRRATVAQLLVAGGGGDIGSLTNGSVVNDAGSYKGLGVGGVGVNLLESPATSTVLTVAGSSVRPALELVTTGVTLDYGANLSQIAFGSDDQASGFKAMGALRADVMGYTAGQKGSHLTLAPRGDAAVAATYFNNEVTASGLGYMTIPICTGDPPAGHDVCFYFNRTTGKLRVYRNAVGGTLGWADVLTSS